MEAAHCMHRTAERHSGSALDAAGIFVSKPLKRQLCFLSSGECDSSVYMSTCITCAARMKLQAGRC